MVLVPTVDRNSINEGLKYINNDACYPTLVTLGNMISTLKSGKFDLDRTAVIMSQTGGGCRASNYIALLLSSDTTWPKTIFASNPAKDLSKKISKRP